MMRTVLVGLAALAMNCSQALADPELLVSHLGINGSGNHEWLVEIDPMDPPSAIAVELAFAVEGTTIVGATINAPDWADDGVPPLGNPGNNPFTGTVTNGLYIDGGEMFLFGAFGSSFGSGGPFPAFPVELLTVETLGPGLTTFSWGEAASPNPEQGDIIAQIGQNFRDYSGTITVPEPTSLVALASFALLGVARRRS